MNVITRVASQMRLLAALLLLPAAHAAQIHTYQKLFDGGPSGYHSFRIPSLVKATNGTLIAIAENRRWSNSDWGDINIVFRRSTDNGATWSALGEIVGSGSGSWTNPTAVTDWTTGRVWVFLSWNDGSLTDMSQVNSWGDRRVFVCHSDDNGATWSVPVDMTNTLLPPNFTWDAMGPGVGIQTTQTHAGRLIIPATGRNIYSDDHGATWQYQLVAGTKSEATIVELVDGVLMRNDRPSSSQLTRRYVAYGSIEGGFGAFTADDVLLDPRCEGSILRYNADSPNRILFLNSASSVTRGKMRVRITYDDGMTWPISRRIYDWLTEDEAVAQGKGGYSSMTKTSDYCVGALIEINEDTSNSSTSHRSIDFHKFNLEWIRSGQPDP